MTRQELEERVLHIIREQKTLALDHLDPDTPLASAGIDSLDALSILFALEETFKITVPDDQARAVRSFKDMVNLVETLLPS